jgi:hypothetical protein
VHSLKQQQLKFILKKMNFLFKGRKNAENFRTDFDIMDVFGKEHIGTIIATQIGSDKL